MKFSGFLFAFIFLLFITITLQCISKGNKIAIEPLRIKSSCYLPKNLYSQIEAKYFNSNDTMFTYLTELCTESHRVIIYKMHDYKRLKYVMDDILYRTLALANTNIKRYKDMFFTKKQVVRLQRCLLEDAFYKLLKRKDAATVFLRFDRASVEVTEGLKVVLDDLPSYYDQVFIKYYVGENSRGTAIIYKKPE